MTRIVEPSGAVKYVFINFILDSVEETGRFYRTIVSLDGTYTAYYAESIRVFGGYEDKQRASLIMESASEYFFLWVASLEDPSFEEDEYRGYIYASKYSNYGEFFGEE